MTETSPMPSSPQKPRRPPVEGKPNGRPKTETARVSHPRLEGMTETVSRVTDTLSNMFKRKQLSEREYLAADRIRIAQDKLYGAAGGAMDFDRVRGGGESGASPQASYMVAADIMLDIKKHLYPKDYAVVYRICAEGMTVECTTANLYQVTPTRAQKEDCGRRLREGLGQMADRWFGQENSNGNNRMRSHISERSGVTDVQSVPRSSTVAHATRDRVVRGHGAG